MKFTSLREQVSETLKSNKTANEKAYALVKLGLTIYEANVLTGGDITRKSPPKQQKFIFSFGVEMEAINCDPVDFMRAASANGISVINHLRQYGGCHVDIPQFKLVPDGSISGANAAECVTPALDSNENGFDSLKACCSALQMISATVNRSCGLHVHIGARELTEEAYCNVFVNYMRLETAIESFLAPSRRGRNARWCASLRNHESRVLAASTKNEMRDALNHDRYHRVNAESYGRHETIEFRQHQGTVNFNKISAWVKFLGKLVEWSRSNRLTENIDRIEDIPFLNTAEKRYFTTRREQLANSAD